MKIVREVPVVDFETTPEGVTIKTHDKMTWNEWDQLVEAIKRPTVIGKPVEGSWTFITGGQIIPGDHINGRPAKPENWFTTINGRSVTRQVKPGYEYVYTGKLQRHDLVYIPLNECWEEMVGGAVEAMDVSSYPAVARKTNDRWYEVTTGVVLPGDRINGIEAPVEQWYRTNIGPSGIKVVRKTVPGYKKMTQGLICKGDLIYNHDRTRYEQAQPVQVGSGVGNFYCVQRKV